MKKWFKITPDGTRDLLFADCATQTSCASQLERLYSARGFSKVITPALEFYDLFTEKTNTIPPERMYKLTDSKGRIIVLRPDCTAPIARLVAAKLSEVAGPLKLYYTQDVYRRNDDLGGLRDEVSQSGIELVGAAGIKADLEVITLALEALESLGLNFTLEIGHVGFFNELVAGVPFSEEDLEDLLAFIEHKNYAALGDLLDAYKDYPEARALKTLPQLFGGREVLDRARALAASDSAKEPLDYLDQLYDRLGRLGAAGRVSIDLGLVQQLDYYTGLVFKAYIDGTGVAALSGGRYDRLYDAFGCGRPAVGFAINVDVAAEALTRAGAARQLTVPQVLIRYQNGDAAGAYTHCAALKREGITAEIDVTDTLEDAIAYARNRGIGTLHTVTADGIKKEEVSAL